MPGIRALWGSRCLPRDPLRSRLGGLAARGLLSRLSRPGEGAPGTGAAGTGRSRFGPAGAVSAAAALPRTARSGVGGFVWRRGDFANYRETDTKNGPPRIAPRFPKSLLLKFGGEVGCQEKAVKCRNNYSRNSYECSASVFK